MRANLSTWTKMYGCCIVGGGRCGEEAIRRGFESQNIVTFYFQSLNLNTLYGETYM